MTAPRREPLAKERLDGIRERLLRLSTPEPNTGCWLWMAHSDADGYGNLSIGNSRNGTQKKLKAHRAAYLVFVGELIPGMCILHSCGNGHLGCVNPEHLYQGVVQDNALDRIKYGRSKKSAKGLPYGAYPAGNRFGSRVSLFKERHHLGNFDTPEEASLAALAARDALLRSRAGRWWGEPKAKDAKEGA